VLLEHQVDVNLTDNDGWTALMVVSNKGYADIVKLLLENDADFDIKEKHGWTAFMLSANKDHKEVMKLITEKYDKKQNQNFKLTSIGIT
jgi:uncharacterized protein